MILLVATICLLADPVTVDCRTAVMRVEATPLACRVMITPTIDLITEAAAGLPVVAILAACKSGVMG